MESTEVKCPCGARLRIVTEAGPGADASKHRYRCPRCGEVRPTERSIVEVSRFVRGEWQSVEVSEWADESRQR
jgi:hypothetical protein